MLPELSYKPPNLEEIQACMKEGKKRYSPTSTPPQAPTPQEEHDAQVKEIISTSLDVAKGRRKWNTEIKIREPKPDYGTEKYFEIEVQKAQQAVIRKELQTVARNQLYEDPTTILPDFACLQPLKLHIEQMNGVNTASGFVFICVSPDSRAESQDLRQLYKLAEKAVHKCWVGEWLFTFEQRGVYDTPEYGTGVHLNFLIKKHHAYMKKAPTDMAREFRNTFKHVIGDGCFSAVDYRYAKDPTNFLSYFAGNKDESHDPEVMMTDGLWREECGLQPYYSSQGWLEHFKQLDSEVGWFYLNPIKTFYDALSEAQK